MQIAMVGLGRMGANIVRRLQRAGHQCVVFDRQREAVEELAQLDGVTGAADLAAMVAQLEAPRVVWVMVPAGVVGAVIADLAPLLSPGDVIIDGGNSYFRDDIDRAAELATRGVHFVDVGTSGGVFGLERGYCLMIGGAPDVVAHLDPIFVALAPGVEAAPRTPGADGAAPAGAPSAAEQGYLHCGPHGAGHFVKMVHNGIEYGQMAALAEGLAILDHADLGMGTAEHSAETSPLRDPAAYRYQFDIAGIAELWRRGSVVSSWLLDLTAHALAKDPELAGFAGRVSDSGEGRWTLQSAIDVGAPAPVLAAALFARFSSRGEADYSNRVLSAMRAEFGGHREQRG